MVSLSNLQERSELITKHYLLNCTHALPGKKEKSLKYPNNVLDWPRMKQGREKIKAAKTSMGLCIIFIFIKLL